MTAERSSGHVFISYVREDTEDVSRLAAALEAGGADVWLDRERLTPGVRWQVAIRDAIEAGAFFLACFSERSMSRDRSYMYEELTIALDELRKRPRDRAWFLPVVLDSGTVPRLDIGAGETLHDLQHVALRDGWEESVERLLLVVGPQGRRRRASARASVPAPRRLGPPVPATETDWGRLFDGVVDTALNLSASDVEDDLIWRATAGMPLPTRSRYASPQGAQEWIRLGEDPQGRRRQHALDFWDGSDGRRIADLVFERVGRADFDYLSLGCGDGRKDAALVDRWLSVGANLTYYPYDVSLPLLSRSIHTVVGRAPVVSRNRLLSKAVLGDIERVDSMIPALGQRSTRTVVGALGESLGSVDSEIQLLRKLEQGLSPEDLLLLEVPLQSDEGFAEVSQSGRLFFAPLASLGLRFDPGRLRFALERDLSTIIDTVTCVATYHGVTLKGREFERIRLAHVHRYDERSLRQALAGVGFEVLHSAVDPRAAMFVAVARPSRHAAS